MRGCSFVCRPVPLRVENSQSLFTAQYDSGEEISFPVAHHDGNYQADEATLDRLEGEGRVAFRYLDEVNGSARDIAGILNDSGNVLGLMPHPERAIEPAHGGTDGRRLFEGLLETCRRPKSLGRPRTKAQTAMISGRGPPACDRRIVVEGARRSMNPRSRRSSARDPAFSAAAQNEWHRELSLSNRPSVNGVKSVPTS